MMIRVAAVRSLSTIAIVRSDTYVAELAALGATQVLVSSAADFGQQLRDASQRLSATIGFDAIAGAQTGELLNAMPGVSCVNSKGAFYLFPNLSKTGLKSADFCARLLEQEKVAAVPGIAFGADDYIRISYATSLANIEKGLGRMDRFVRSL